MPPTIDSGLPVENHSRGFRILERLDNTEEHAGARIGLAIVEKAARRMGGTVSTEGDEAGGSAVWGGLVADPNESA